MLEGLEISEVTLLDLREESKFFRIDSDFFGKEYVALDTYIKEKNHFFLPQHIIVSGPFGSSLKSEAYLSSGIPFIRIENIKSGFAISKDSMIYISPQDNRRLKSSQLKCNDLILSKVGNTIGFYARVDEEIGECNISENNIGIKLDGFTLEEKHYILVYFNSKYGNGLTLRRISGNAQPKLNVYDVSEIPIPKMDISIMQSMSFLVVSSTERKKQSERLYNQAENLLLQELGFEDWEQNTENVSVKSLKDSFCSSGRLDAEYYQPKFDELLARLSNLEHDRIANIAHLKKSIEPGSEAYQDSGIPFVRVADVTKLGISKPSIYLSPNEYDIEGLKPRKDTILLSKDGSVGIAYKVENDLDCITSGALLHLNVFNKDYIPDYLTLVLNSFVVQMQAERDAGGSIIQHWKPSEIENVIIPKLPMAKQQEIAAKIQESFALRHESERLLDVAKKAVEIAISKSEDFAIKYLEENKN